MTLDLATKTCRGCKAEKPAGEFHKDRRALSGLLSYCGVCNTAKSSANQKANPEKTAERNAIAQKKASATLSDSYIRTLLSNNGGPSRASIPQSLIELKRVQLQISNHLKEQSKCPPQSMKSATA